MMMVPGCGMAFSIFIPAMFMLVIVLQPLLQQTQAAAGITYKQYNANIKGRLLVLDVGGLHFQGSHPGDPLITKPAQCRAWCDRTPGCTAWVLCNKTTGCGSGCEAYNKAHPFPYKDPPNATKRFVGNLRPFWFSPDAKLPIESFGYLTGGNKCTADDKWPWGLCSMKAVAKPSKPGFFSTNAADGWVSGVVLLPPSCKGVSAITCKQCLASKDPKGCLACAKAAARVAEIGNVADEISKPTWTEGCAACTTLSGANRALCYKCLTSGSMCGNCATKVDPYDLEQNPTPYFNLASCLSCTKQSPRTYEECRACARLKAPAVHKKCNECISKLGVLLDWLPRDTYNRRLQTGDFCSKCAQALPVADRCIKCGKEMPYNDDCWGCVSSNVDPSSRNRCYDCAFKTKTGGDAAEYSRFSHAGKSGECTQCLQKTSVSYPPSVATSLKGQCFACLTDPKVTGKAKYWCNRCYTQAKTAQGRSKCLACLKKAGRKDYATCPVK